MTTTARPSSHLIAALPIIVSLAALTGCPTLKPILKTVNDIAYDLCVAERSKAAPQLSPEDIGRAFCATEEALKPFIDALLTAKKLAAAGATGAAPSASAAPSAILYPAPSVASAHGVAEAKPASSVSSVSSATPPKAKPVSSTLPPKAAKP